MDALRVDTLLGVESEDHDWGRQWQITVFCLTPLFLLYACAIGFAFVILLFYAVMRRTVRFCMLQFANAFCRKGPVNFMRACCVSFPVTGCPESLAAPCKMVLFREEALYFKV